MSYLPHELVATQILLHLPIRSLLRFRCVCKAWRDIMADDFFHRAHLRLQNMVLLIAPKIENRNDAEVATAGLYRWEDSHQEEATLVHAMSGDDTFFPNTEVAHDLGHCDGLVLVPAEAKVRVINPATRRALTLPSNPHILTSSGGIPGRINGYQAFGLGHDPRSNTYKVARFFYRSLEYKNPLGNIYTLGMEVYTIGAADHWRETSTPPPYPIIPGRTSTFFKGSLLWTIHESMLKDTMVAPGFLRFKLEDESFSVTPPPPCRHKIYYTATSLAELRGELCVCVPKSGMWYEMWMCGNLDEVPQWDRRHVVTGVSVFPSMRSLRPVVAYDDVIILHEGHNYLCRCDRTTRQTSFKPGVSIGKMRYHHPDTCTVVQYQTENLDDFAVVPYIPSLVPL